MSLPILCATAAVLTLASSASAEIYEVRFIGTIEWNQIAQPPLSLGTAGSPAEVVMKVDSAVFTNSPNYPVRGYRIDQPSFKFIVNGTPVGMNPAIHSPQYFVIRNNDPASDGFFISSEVDWPLGVQLAQSHATLGPFTEMCSISYEGSTLSSLNIQDAEGTYEYDGLEVFHWETSAGPFSPMGMIFDRVTITRLAPPCPADLSGDGVVDGADLGTLLGAWNTANAAADLNHDGIVDGADLGDLLGSWGDCD